MFLPAIILEPPDAANAPDSPFGGKDARDHRLSGKTSGGFRELPLRIAPHSERERRSGLSPALREGRGLGGGGVSRNGTRDRADCYLRPATGVRTVREDCRSADGARLRPLRRPAAGPAGPVDQPAVRADEA